MSDYKRHILEMVASGKISVDEAIKLLAVINDSAEDGKAIQQKSAREKFSYLRVVIDRVKKDSTSEKANIRVPISLIRAGMKFTSLLPEEASAEVEKELQKKGVKLNLKNLREDDLEVLLMALRELEVNIDDGSGTVRVYTE